jgi:hypothetical protein
MKNRFLDRRALSMLEVTIVVLVIGLAILPVFGIFTNIFKSTELTMQEIQGTNYASELMDALQALQYDELPVVETLTQISDITIGKDTLEERLHVTESTEAFTRMVEIVEKTPAWPDFESESDIAGIKERIGRINRFKLLTVKVTWKDEGFGREAILKTIKSIGRRGELGL